MIPGWEAKVPHASWPKKQIINNRGSIVISSTETLKMVHIKKKSFKKIFKKKGIESNLHVIVRCQRSCYALSQK